VFERFTDRGRRVVVLAQEEARILHHNFIGTEHILLGLLHEGEGPAAQALKDAGVTLEPARNAVSGMVGPTDTTTGSPPFTPRAKKVLELSLREALQLGHNYIGTEHLLLGLLREGEGVAVQVVVALGADLARVRQDVIRLMATGARAESPAAPAELRDGPRCPSCRSTLDGNVGYRILPVPPADAGTALEPIDVVFVYCLRCGVVVAHTPAAALGDPT
jgi:ATP-dependent Clp protease ATP-binding subunit ClpC